MLTGDRAKYLGLIFAIAFCTLLLENQTSIFASILKRTGSQILDVTDADVWVMDARTEYFEQTKALKDTDLTRVRPRRFFVGPGCAAGSVRERRSAGAESNDCHHQSRWTVSRFRWGLERSRRCIHETSDTMIASQEAVTS